jgi:hypothetical protein
MINGIVADKVNAEDEVPGGQLAYGEVSVLLRKDTGDYRRIFGVQYAHRGIPDAFIGLAVQNLSDYLAGLWPGSKTPSARPASRALLRKSEGWKRDNYQQEGKKIFHTVVLCHYCNNPYPLRKKALKPLSS